MRRIIYSTTIPCSQILIKCEQINNSINIKNYNYSIDDNVIIINTKDPNKELPIIMKELNQLDVSIINVEIKKSSLEQVFLKLTKNETTSDASMY